MYRQLQNSKSRHLTHWHDQESLDEFEALLDSDYLGYLDPGLVKHMKRIIQNRRGKGGRI